jgi:cyclophilin family peptidyl-prolyl cis-trans isomerase
LEAVIETDHGTIRFDLFPEAAPKHVEMFVRLAREKYYDGSGFFRVSKAFIQGGDPNLKEKDPPQETWGKGGYYAVQSEKSTLSHLRGTVSGMRKVKDNTDGVQFFICVKDMTGFDGGFPAFGRVTEGMDVVDKISKEKVVTPESGIVETLIRIKSIRIEKKKAK